MDRYLEHCDKSTSSKIIYDNIGFGDSSLVIAVPESWIDVDNIYDLIEISYEYKNNSENLKLATKYPNLVRRSLEKFDVNNIVFVSALIILVFLVLSPVSYTHLTLPTSDLV